MSASRQRSVHPGTQALSWAIFLLMLFQMYMSTRVATTPRGSSARELLAQTHYSTGLVLLLLVAVRLWIWFRTPRAAPAPRVPMAADALAGHCNLAFYLTMLAMALTGPAQAWSEGHAVHWFGLISIPNLLAASYGKQVLFGYLHSAVGFWILFLTMFSIGVSGYQRLRYGAPLLRMLPGFSWGGAVVPDAALPRKGTGREAEHADSRYPGSAKLLHGALFGLLLVAGAYMPYRVFGVIPFSTTAQLVPSGPPPAVDSYADVVAAPALTSQGQQDFKWCRFCHSFEKGAPNAVGPNLYRVFGRRVASAPGFLYSDAFVTAGRSGAVWDDALVEQLLTDPAKFLGGNHRMRFKPIVDPAERKDIVAALKYATK